MFTLRVIANIPGFKKINLGASACALNPQIHEPKPERGSRNPTGGAQTEHQGVRDPQREELLPVSTDTAPEQKLQRILSPAPTIKAIPV